VHVLRIPQALLSVIFRDSGSRELRDEPSRLPHRWNYFVRPSSGKHLSRTLCILICNPSHTLLFARQIIEGASTRAAEPGRKPRGVNPLTSTSLRDLAAAWVSSGSGQARPHTSGTTPRRCPFRAVTTRALFPASAPYLFGPRVKGKAQTAMHDTTWHRRREIQF